MAAPSQTNTTITTGGTAQTGAPADGKRAYLLVQNNDANEDLWVNFLGVAAVDSGIRIPGGGDGEWTFEQMPSIMNAMSVCGATTGHKFSVTTDVN
jgi:hypothetical protein